MTNSIPMPIPSNSTEYIPYSIRHNIADPDLAGFLDYLEGDIGADITIESMPFAKLVKYRNIRIGMNPWEVLIEVEGESEGVYMAKRNIFFRTYRSLLPAIRDLYSK